ncbi:MAG: YaaR family protein, partial [Clostridiaceae bacterium]|nr:YaaR family protein [Clostridiaceae bacterium]
LAVGKSKKFSKRSLLDRRGRHRGFAIVRTINEELERLTEDVLNGEKDNLGLLRRLEDIRGLILDLLA